MKNYYEKEMENLNNQIKGLRDPYNTIEPAKDIDEYRNVIKSDSTLDYAIQAGETLKKYQTKLEMHVKYSIDKNWKIHVAIGSKGRPWYNHKSPLGCFMCQDNDIKSYMLNLIRAITAQYPDLILLP